MATWLVTGADRGIGAAMCAALAARGDHVIAACLGHDVPTRNGIDIVCGVDVGSADGVERLARHLGARPIDVIVHNAGCVFEAPFGALDFDSMQREYAVNALGPLRVTQALASNLREGGKVGIVSSRVGSLGENGSGGLYGYRMSKAAANMASRNLAHELRPRRIAVIALHPGSVRTQMTAGLTDATTVGQLVAPEQAALGLIARLDELQLASSGVFLHANGEALPW